MFFKLITILSLLLLANAQPNYQERNVYYNESENSCRHGDYGDKINLIINLDDQERIKREVDGGTWCNPNPIIPTRYASCIITSDKAYLIEGEGRDIVTDLRLNQAATKKYTFGLLSQLIIKATPANPSKINNKNYDCTIFGDGTIQHFGTYLATDPAEIYMRCVSDKSKEQKAI